MTSSHDRSFRLVATNPKDQRLRLYRGPAMSKLDQTEIADLLGDGDQKLRSVIDIRTKQEIGAGNTYPLPDDVTYRVMEQSGSGEFTEVRSCAEEPQVTFYRIDFYTLTKKLKIFLNLFWNNWRLALSGWRRTNTASGLGSGIMTKLFCDVANSKGFVGMYMDWLDPSMDCSGLVAVFRLLNNSDIYPAMLHCQYGKDRTGTVCALLQLMDPSMTDDQVVAEYHESENYIAHLIPGLEAMALEVGMPLECARCPKELMREVIAWIRKGYGTAELYLQHIGLQESEVTAIKTALGYINS